MSGLDKMKARILEEAQNTAREIIDKAQTDAEKDEQAAGGSGEAGGGKIVGRAKREGGEYGKR